MNYRHQYHAGNFADVMKHALLVRLIQSLQQKPKGFLYLDTHAGRGSYDLARAATGDSLARAPEWPDGVGRILREAEVPAPLADYLGLIREFDRSRGNLAGLPRFYPGSPWIARKLARPQDRLVLVEKHPAEAAALRDSFAPLRGVSVQEMDGYAALRAVLPPPERRALVLIDPPYEAPSEFALLREGLREGLARFSSGVFAIWYPLTARAQAGGFTSMLRTLPAPVLRAELAVAGESSGLKMRGCGLGIVNPPWQFEHACRPLLDYLAAKLAQQPGAGACVDWLVPERES